MQPLDTMQVVHDDSYVVTTNVNYSQQISGLVVRGGSSRALTYSPRNEMTSDGSGALVQITQRRLVLPKSITRLIEVIASFLRKIHTSLKFPILKNGFVQRGLPHPHLELGMQASQRVEMPDLTWANVEATIKEKESVKWIQDRVDLTPLSPTSQWKLTQVIILRFLRAKGGNREEGLKMLQKHIHWRSSKYGADTPLAAPFASIAGPLNKEIFWLQGHKNDCPTIVVRSMIHDGIYYNEDPHWFTHWMVRLLEEGRKRYGVGEGKQACLLVDRSPVELVVEATGATVKFADKMDMSVVPRLVELFQVLTSTLLDNYPDLLDTAIVAPTSFFFSLCFRVTSRVLDKKSREKFIMISDKKASLEMQKLFDISYLPDHFGGSARQYGDGLPSM